jgi:hypothetical protein
MDVDTTAVSLRCQRHLQIQAAYKIRLYMCSRSVQERDLPTYPLGQTVGNCYKQCIAHALGGVCVDTTQAANEAPGVVFSPSCRSVAPDACVINFVQPSVT